MKTLEELKKMINTTNDDLEKYVFIHNYKAVLYSDQVIDGVFETLNKYTGKKIGKATMDKINIELSTRFEGLHVYMATDYDGKRKEITVFRRSEGDYFISYHDDVKIEIKAEKYKERDLFDEKCNFKGITKENCFVFGKVNYIEDVKEYIIMKKQQFTAIQNVIDDYEKLCKVFNDNKVYGLAEMPWIRKPHYITK